MMDDIKFFNGIYIVFKAANSEFSPIKYVYISFATEISYFYCVPGLVDKFGDLVDTGKIIEFVAAGAYRF